MEVEDGKPAFGRSFTGFSQAIDEVVDARVWSGIHFRTADEQGARVGRQVAKSGTTATSGPVRSHSGNR